MDSTRFVLACQQVTEQHERYNIGTYQEKTVHAVLKQYFQPDTAFHEQAAAGFVADICFGDEIYEIQTRQFYHLNRKLDAYLKGNYQVTIVYPVPVRKWLSWVDAETGEITERRKSPKKGRAADVFRELYQIRKYLSNDRLRICLMLLETEEFRLLDGYGKDKKKRSTRYDHVPLQLEQEVWLRQPADYRQLIPEDLPESFTSRDFASAAHIPANTARYGLLLLHDLGLVERIAKQGTQYVYQLMA
ncbi:MAG: hypothetical protein IJV50_11980 [Lachnospiraceae bacterium]|nr:hypothetical protein [Lachnospiraceae bacterium]